MRDLDDKKKRQDRNTMLLEAMTAIMERMVDNKFNALFERIWLSKSNHSHSHQRRERTERWVAEHSIVLETDGIPTPSLHLDRPTPMLKEAPMSLTNPSPVLPSEKSTLLKSIEENFPKNNPKRDGVPTQALHLDQPMLMIKETPMSLMNLVPVLPSEKFPLLPSIVDDFPKDNPKRLNQVNISPGVVPLMPAPKQEELFGCDRPLCAINYSMGDLLVREAHGADLMGHFGIAKTLRIQSKDPPYGLQFSLPIPLHPCFHRERRPDFLKKITKEARYNLEEITRRNGREDIEEQTRQYATTAVERQDELALKGEHFNHQDLADLRTNPFKEGGYDVILMSTQTYFDDLIKRAKDKDHIQGKRRGTIRITFSNRTPDRCLGHISLTTMNQGLKPLANYSQFNYLTYCEGLINSANE